MSTKPWSLWAFSLIIALIGVYNLALGLDHAMHAAHYRDLGVSYPPLLRAALALFWGVAWLTFARGLALRKNWARRWLVIFTSNYGAFGVLWMIGFADSDFGRGRIAFQAAITVLLVALAAWALRWQRMRRPFEEHGRQPSYDG